MKFKEWNDATNKWFKDKEIYKKGNILAQFEKLQEEVEELNEGLRAKIKSVQHFTDSKGRLQETNESIKDAIGDCTVVLRGLCGMLDLDLLDCMNHAFKNIKDRKGKMINGQFVKN